MAEAKQAGLAALDAGTMSERAVAEALGVDRNTVRAWQGKTGAAKVLA
jgi:transposase